MDEATLKRKLRQLKKFEIRTRFQNGEVPKKASLVWNTLFENKKGSTEQVKYTIDYLLSLTKDEIKNIYDIFFSMVYYRYYSENGITFDTYYDVKLLDVLELPYNSSKEDIKTKFRTLAKKYHPDMGGDSARFIELMNIYNGLLKK